MKNRPGLTATELVVSLAIGGLMIAMTLSAVQKARVAADRLHCASNLRQAGLAARLHYDLHRHWPKTVPPGYRCPTHHEHGSGYFWWPAHHPLYSEGGDGVHPLAGDNHPRHGKTENHLFPDGHVEAVVPGTGKKK